MKKRCCSECKFFKHEDKAGLGYCDLWEQADVDRKTEACVEFDESKLNELNYD